MKKEFSACKTARDALIVATTKLKVDGNSFCERAMLALPSTRPMAQAFYAWELYYKRPDPFRATLEAMDRR